MSAFRNPASFPDFFARVASTAAGLSHSGLGAIDGITPVAGDRVLDKDNATGSLQGLWCAASGAWVRAPEFGGAGLIPQDVPPGHTVRIADGTVNADTEWQCTTNGLIVPGTTALAYKRFDGAWDEWETLYSGSAVLASGAAGSGANNYVLRTDGGTPALSNAALTAPSCVFPLDPANYAVTGKTLQVRIVAHVLTLGTAPGINFSFSLYQVLSIAAGVPSLGTTFATLAINTPALNTMTTQFGSSITMPAAGTYFLGVATSGANAATTPQMRAALQVRAV